MAGENPTSSGSSGAPVLPKFYAVKSGRVPGIYTDWPSAQEQITGWQKPKHRCFTTRAEARRFLDDYEHKTVDSSDAPGQDAENPTMNYSPEESAYPPTGQPAPKRAKKPINGIKPVKSDAPEYNEIDYEPGTAPLPPSAEDGFDPNIILNPETGTIVYKTQEQRQATKPDPAGASQTGPIRIHTDGSSLGNGTAGAFAGVGVYFGPKDKR